jgi:hypothetical protein
MERDALDVLVIDTAGNAWTGGMNESALFRVLRDNTFNSMPYAFAGANLATTSDGKLWIANGTTLKLVSTAVEVERNVTLPSGLAMSGLHRHQRPCLGVDLSRQAFAVRGGWRSDRHLHGGGTVKPALARSRRRRLGA